MSMVNPSTDILCPRKEKDYKQQPMDWTHDRARPVAF
jgi:hypothetical protein